MNLKRKTNRIESILRVPERVRSGELRLAKYCIYPLGLASDTVNDVVIDRRIALIQQHPESILYLCPLRQNPHPTAAAAWFYCDCIAYEHDIPAIVYPTPSELSEFRYRYIHNGPTKSRPMQIEHLGKKHWTETFIKRPMQAKTITRLFLMDQLLSVFDEARQIRHGPLTFVLFRTHRQHRRVYLDYSNWYGKAAKEISLFSTALRQPDFLAEFLGYYRIIESITQSNGKKWITDALDRLPSQKWNSILLGHDEDQYAPRNLLGAYSRRASIRLRELRKRLGTSDRVAHYLYNVQRCGIAHGRGQIVRGDVSPTYFEVARDTMILKLLARMAIEEKRQ